MAVKNPKLWHVLNFWVLLGPKVKRYKKRSPSQFFYARISQSCIGNCTILTYFVLNRSYCNRCYWDGFETWFARKKWLLRSKSNAGKKCFSRFDTFFLVDEKNLVNATSSSDEKNSSTLFQLLTVVYPIQRTTSSYKIFFFW